MKRWTEDQPEPDSETMVSVDALDCSWRLPWKTVREDALSGLASVWLEEEDDDDAFIEDAENSENETGFASFNDTMD